MVDLHLQQGEVFVWFGLEILIGIFVSVVREKFTKGRRGVGCAGVAVKIFRIALGTLGGVFPHRNQSNEIIDRNLDLWTCRQSPRTTVQQCPSEIHR